MDDIKIKKIEESSLLIKGFNKRTKLNKRMDFLACY